MATAKKAAKKTTKKSTAKKSPAKKVAAKTSSKKSASDNVVLKDRVEQLLNDMKERAEGLQGDSEKAGLATLGLYGKVYDFAVEQVEKARAQRDERVEELVSRGETVRKDIQARIDDIELPSSLESVQDSLKEQVESVKESAEEMREKLNDSFESIKEKVVPANA